MLRSQKTFILLIWAALALSATSTTVRAEDDPRPRSQYSASLDAAVDLRARVPSRTGDTSASAHAGYFRLQFGAENPEAVRVHLFGLDQYGSFRLQQASVEKEWGSSTTGSRLPQRLQAGILRVPFGIYDYRETYASGLIDYPLPRVDFAYNAVDWGVSGVQWSGGNASVQADVAGFSGQASGIWGNIQHAEGVAGRVQVFLPPGVVVGVSNWQGRAAGFDRQTARESQPVHFGGIDLRYTLDHLLVRGEFMAGAMPYARHTRGGYLDAYYRLPGMEQFTLVGRAEALRPGDENSEARQLTLGVRWTATPNWMVSANWRRNNLRQAYPFTWTRPAEGRGDLYLQALYTISLSRVFSPRR